VDEGNNWINMAFGPLSLVSPTGTTLGNYSINTGSTAIDSGNNTGAPPVDIFGTTRPQGARVDIGAVEFVGPAAAAVASVTGGPLVFGNVATGTSSAAQTLTLHNTGNAPLTGITYTFTSGYARATGGGGGTCGPAPATLSVVTGSCTINVVFTPTAAGASTGTFTINANVAVTGSPVGLSGTGVTPVRTATLTPATWSPTATRGIGTAGPTQVFTLTNTGNVNLTGINMGTLSGTNSGAFTISPRTCGTAGNTTLAPNGTCTVTVRFQPPTTGATGVKNATLTVNTPSAGNKTAVLSGTAQ
jgi:hypothetical protein